MRKAHEDIDFSSFFCRLSGNTCTVCCVNAIIRTGNNHSFVNCLLPFKENSIVTVLQLTGVVSMPTT